MTGEWSMKPRNFAERGQVLIIFVFAIIGLVGITGLAIDGSYLLADRKNAQNAADAAALAAAMYKVGQKPAEGACITEPTADQCGLDTKVVGLNMARDNGYFRDIVNVDVEVHSPPISGYYSQDHLTAIPQVHRYDYVQVIIHTNLNTWFAKVLGIGQTHNRVEAVALARYRPASPLYGGDALVILAPHAVNGSSGEFGTKGTADIKVDGGDVFVNSDSSTAFVEASCIIFDVTPNGHYVKYVGDDKTPICTPPDHNPPMLDLNPSDQVEFPPEQPIAEEPKECTQTPVAQPDWPDGYAHLMPGHYITAGSNKFPPDRNARLDPGVYCIDALLKTNNPNTHLVGDGVFLYIRKGGSFNFGGGWASLTAPAAGSPYAGWLIYATPDYSLSPGSVPECTINAGAGDVFTGVIYAPYCNTTINGGSDSVGLRAKLIVYTLLINGTNALTFYYDSDMDPGIPERIYTGLYH